MDSHAALRTLQKKRTTNFREDETKLLIQLWGSPQIQNKLYLTHRKAPVMRLLATNMQQRGFYRTPDEIKTRIRNLKCLYHRIKRSTQSGVGIGTVDPDWPHFKAMDDILSKKNQQRPHNLYKDNVFEGPRCEDIKQEIIDDIDINDDMESFTTNSLNGSDGEFEDEAHHMPPLTPAPSYDKKEKDEPELVKIAPKPLVMPQPKVTSSSNVQIPIPGGIRTNGTTPALPFPLLILNGLPNSMSQNQSNAQTAKKEGSGGGVGLGQADVSTLLKSLLEVQKENLEIEKQRLELEKQKLEFQQLVGSQLLTLLPMFGGLLQRLAFPKNHNTDVTPTKRETSPPKKNGLKRQHPDNDGDILKDSKILRNVLEEGIKKYMMSESSDDKVEVSGILQNDDNSDSSK